MYDYADVVSKIVNSCRCQIYVTGLSVDYMYMYVESVHSLLSAVAWWICANVVLGVWRHATHLLHQWRCLWSLFVFKVGKEKLTLGLHLRFHLLALFRDFRAPLCACALQGKVTSGHISATTFLYPRTYIHDTADLQRCTSNCWRFCWPSWMCSASRSWLLCK